MRESCASGSERVLGTTVPPPSPHSLPLTVLPYPCVSPLPHVPNLLLSPTLRHHSAPVLLYLWAAPSIPCIPR